MLGLPGSPHVPLSNDDGAAVPVHGGGSNFHGEPDHQLVNNPGKSVEVFLA